MNLRTKIILFLNKSFLWRKMAYYYQRWSVNRNPMKEIRRNYVYRFGKEPNLEKPRNLIEKIYWMQLHCDTSVWTLCADKYRMREYVKSRGCADYLPKLCGVWNSAAEIEWESLPQQFVIKINNGCASVLVVNNKDDFNEYKVKKQMKHWLDIPYGYRGYQPHYLGIKPCILAEELLHQDESLNVVSCSMVDFKVWCFNGRAESILVAYNRRKTLLNIDLYDTNWDRLSNNIRSNGLDKVNNEVVFPKPDCLDLMLSIAGRLSAGHPQMRVDFYVVDNKPVIGELTMATGYGYFTEEYYNHLGDLTDVSLIKRIK